jgi:signal transduction histidine kinase
VAEPALLNQIREATETLSREVRVQRLLGRDDPGESRLDIQEVRPGDILKRIEAIFARRPVAEGQSLVVDWPQSEVPFETDTALLVRVLLNMVINAFEAGEPGDQVRIGIEEADEDVTFYVWNRQAIPQSVSLRVFQRYFSTKEGDGRGWGTFAMKLIGETLLKGKVSFSTSEGAGTTFRIRHPRHLRPVEKPVAAASRKELRVR